MNAFDVFNPFRLDARTRSYKGVSQYLSDPTDLLHIWSCRDVSRNSSLLGATLKRSLDGVEADFGFTSKGYLDRAAVLAWAGASAVSVVRLWGLGGEQLGAERIPQPLNFASGWVNGAATVITATEFSNANGGGMSLVGIPTGKYYKVDLTANIKSNSAGVTIGIAGAYAEPLAANSLIYRSLAVGDVSMSKVLYSPTTEGRFYIRFVGAGRVDVGNLSIREILRPNAIQTTVLNMPPLDLTSNPLRIGAAAGTSLVATMPAITNGIMLRASGGNVYQETVSFTASQAYNVVNNQAFCERVILKSDTPAEDVAKVKANMVLGWKANGEVFGPELVDTLNTPATWVPYGTNTIVSDDGAIKVTAVSNSVVCYTGYLRETQGLSANLVIGKDYKFTFLAKTNSTFGISVFDGSSMRAVYTALQQQDYAQVSFSFKAYNATGCYVLIDTLPISKSVWVKDISVREVIGGA